MHREVLGQNKNKIIWPLIQSQIKRKHILYFNRNALQQLL